MANYKFTVNCETTNDTEVFNTNDFNSAVMKFEQYVQECDELELSYDINIIDNRTGEIYEYVAHHSRRVTEGELAELDRAFSEEDKKPSPLAVAMINTINSKARETVFPEESPQTLGKTFADCVNENIPDELIDTVWRIIEGE
jgi:hypothetical protein